MTTPTARPARPGTPTLLLGALMLAVGATGASHAEVHVPPPDCVPSGGNDANGDGLDDDLVSIRARITDSEISCDARIGPGTSIVRARVVPATDGPDLVSPAIGARTFVGEGALIEGATLGNAVTVLGGAQLVSTLNSQVIVGNRVFIGREARVSGGNGDAEIGNGAIILRGASIRGGTIGPRLTLGANSSLEDVGTGRAVVIGANTTVGFESFLGPRVRLGDDVTLESFNLIGRATTVGRGTTISSSDIGARTVIGENVTIDSATIGNRVTIGDGATIEGRGVDIPNGTVIAPGEVVAAPF